MLTTIGKCLAVVAAEPWRPMRVFAGADPASLTARGDIDEPAIVGQLVGGLSKGPRHRWDEVNTLEVRVEGRAPESLPTSAVLAGGNAIAVETAMGLSAQKLWNAKAPPT